MPLTTPVLTVDADNIHKVDTANAQSLHGMWMVFSKCADYMDQGRRLENLSWRLWTRETFCVEPEKSNSTSALPLLRSEAGDLPELSASVESAASDQAERIEAHIKRPKFSDYRPAVVREDSLASLGRGKEKHITSLDLERMVLNIKEKKQLEPMPTVEPAAPVVDITPRPSTPTPTPPPSVSTARQVPNFSVRPTPYPHESTESCSTTAPEGNESDTAQLNASDTSVSSSGILPSRPQLVKSTSIVRGFSPSHISSSFRSQPRLSIEPSPSRSATQLKPSPLKKKGGMFTLGGSSGDDDESSFEERMVPQAAQENATGGLKPKNNTDPTKKTASFSNQVSSHIIPNSKDISRSDEDAIETDDEVSESAIEDDEDSDWEDSITEGGESSVDEQGGMFQRVDSRPNLVSRRSMLTMMMHQPARMQGNAFRSSPALQRSRLTSPSGPSIPQSPPSNEEESLVMRGPDVPRSKPIVMNTNASQSMAHSPRTTRRNMLATELTESLRRHLLWERQQKSATANAFLKRRHTAHDMKNLQEYPGPKGPHKGVGPNQASAEADPNAADLGKNGSWTNYTTDYGPWEYHVKGW
ncbi:unnamed protein product [Penicillium nalgiovense]|uniref:Uncharacterized protein n=1 Tax=Penicillium nalgiovense TaxID=60175 RepID=A0A1V6YM87_PENNA|nr:hypothetical protein PENNAL_c0017G06450 [Penicillium nalgiovense]CAG7935417.1 unnamed protein product [Penicillium nalgiovense]CAG7938401.1 unnamed protein product [Penicillium nalgiovense]CAG8066070.1 unnamed protein product [Penicillium nalgiovense]CAG8083653.1 unnamed protein product [Penicillium nalgiovense]